jgi:hypothetical protein
MQARAMDSKALTREQATKMAESVGRQLSYLRRLLKRMEQQHFPMTDRLYVDTTVAHNAVYALRVNLLYLCCDPGTTMDHERPRTTSPPAHEKGVADATPD